MKGWGLPWLVLGLAGAGIGPGAEPPLRIQADASYTRTLSSGEIHLYHLTLEPGDYARLEVVQQGLDVATVVRGPSGSQVVAVDTTTGRFSTERISLLADEKGDYAVEIRPAFAADRGDYRRTAPTGSGSRPNGPASQPAGTSRPPGTPSISGAPPAMPSRRRAP